MGYFSFGQFDEKLVNWKNELPNNFKNLNDINVLPQLFMYIGEIYLRNFSDSDRAYVSEILESCHKWAHSK